MEEPRAPGVSQAAPAGAIDSRGAFAASLHEALAAALARRARRMVWVDPDFSGWPLDDAAWLQRLGEWLRLPQRRLLLLASDFDGLRQRCPRFVAGYRLWSHAIAASSPLPEDAVELPSLLLAEGTVLVQLLDKSLWRGWSSSEPAALRSCQERVDALQQRAAPAFPVTTLGL
ncbi:MAG TPA: hypothetical protein PKB14_21625 [Rubrivivax sp.]|nr:hypothetical protein [Rubrivivax sp.]